MINKESFFKLFETSFWKKLNESVIPFNDIDRITSNKYEFLDKLYRKIIEYTYSPSCPRGYIMVNKGNGVTRYVPTFEREDYCVYFLCIKLLEDEIAIDRVPGSFGGWRLGNPISLKEEQEYIELLYVSGNSLNEVAWSEEWRSFQRVARVYGNHEDYEYIIKFDIANFYDTINLAVLEKKIRHSVVKSKQDFVTLLFHFLRNWNRKIEGYNLKTVGLPQDEISDCSRILANFYLQDYDSAMQTVCERTASKYIRFADDQIVFTNSKKIARQILIIASKELFKIGLNINSSKVQEFNSKNEFDTYWAFDIFDLLEDKNNREKINNAVVKYFNYLDNGITFRDHSVLERLLNVDFQLIAPRYRHRLISNFFDEDFLLNLESRHFLKIRNIINDDIEFFNQLDRLIPNALFNCFLYNLRSFYKKHRKDYNLTYLDDRINEVNLMLPSNLI